MTKLSSDMIKYGYEVQRETLIMTPDEWAQVPENPKQRDTVKHAIYAEQNHLKSYTPAQNVVYMGITKDGERFKVNGHTRCLLWAEGRLEKPPFLIVIVYRCVSEEIVTKIYDTHDSSEAAQSTSDKLFSACHLEDLKFTSPLMRRMRFTKPVRLCELLWSSRGQVDVAWRRGKGEPIENILEPWARSLAALDSLNVKKDKMFPAFVIAAFMMSYRAYGQKVMPFWSKYRDGRGVRTDRPTTSDCVYVLDDMVKTTKLSREIVVNVRRVISIVEKHLKGQVYVGKIQVYPVDWNEFFKRVEKAPRSRSTHDEPAFDADAFSPRVH